MRFALIINSARAELKPGQRRGSSRMQQHADKCVFTDVGHGAKLMRDFK
jgi:hypothetical protein